MKPLFRIIFVLELACGLLLTSCATPIGVPPLERENIYQVSTLNSLTARNFDGIKTVQQVLQKGDFGVGTFDGLNGEMVLVDGKIYQVKDSGKVETPAVTATLPYAVVTYFDADITKDLNQVPNFAALQKDIDPLIVKKDRFYAIRIDGVFSQIKVRSESQQQKPYPTLTDALKNQSVFTYENVKGTLVGFWCPDDIGTLNAIGYHLHFISADHSQGGHVLEVSINNATVKLDETPHFDLDLSDSNGK